MSSYETNRRMVYQIYGIDVNDKSYNCHHIVTRQDYKNGLVPFDFDINSLSNLYPIKITDHHKIHTKIDELEGIVLTPKIYVEPRQNLINIEDIIKKRSRFAKEIRRREHYRNMREIITRIELQKWREGALDAVGY